MLVSIFIVMFMALNVSAFLNIKGDLIIDETTSKYGKIEIRDWGGLSSLAELELKKNTDEKPCANDCSAELEIIMHQRGVLIDSNRFMEIYHGEWIETNIRSYQFYIQDGEITVDDYENVLKGVAGNGSGIYSYEKVGSHKEPNWIPYELGTEVGVGTYNIKLVGEKDVRREIDWQITSQGKLIDEWARWGGNTELFEFHFGSDDDQDDTTGANWNSQGFTPGNVSSCVSFIPTNISIQFDRLGAEGYNCTVGIRNTGSDHKPTGIDFMNVSMNISAVEQGVGNKWFNFSLDIGYNNGTDTLDCPTQYSLVWRCPLASGNNYRWAMTAAPLYKGGNRSDSANSGATWTLSQFVLQFKVFGYEPEGVELISPLNNTIISTNQINFTANYSSVGISISNATYNIWDSDGNLFNQTIVSVPNTNTTTLQIGEFVADEYFWNVEVCGVNATASTCDWSDNNFSFIWRPFSVIDEFWNNKTTEGNTELFRINITLNSGFTISQANLIYNSTSSPGGVLSTGGNNYTLIEEITIPGVRSQTNVSFYWSVIMGDGSIGNTTARDQTILNLSIDDCSTFTNQIYNFTVVDEET